MGDLHTQTLWVALVGVSVARTLKLFPTYRHFPTKVCDVVQNLGQVQPHLKCCEYSQYGHAALNLRRIVVEVMFVFSPGSNSMTLILGDKSSWRAELI